ncbi:hypothetical protein ES702_03989 [subsurface metagenome]
MVYITKRTPSNYRTRHTDWYNGVFRDVVHQIGLVGEALFWLDCEGKASFADALIPDWYPLTEMQKAIIGLFRGHYASKYTDVYDDWALQACKSFEVLEGQINGVLGQIKEKVDEAKAYINNNLINPLKNQINNEVVPAINDALAKIRTAEATIRDAQVSINEALADVVNLDRSVTSLNTQVKDARTKIDAAISDFDTKIRDVNKAITDANWSIGYLKTQIKNFTDKMNTLDTRIKEATNIVDGHTIDIKDLWDSVQALQRNGVVPPTPFSFEKLVEDVRRALI